MSTAQRVESPREASVAHDEIVAALSDPGAYPERTRHVKEVQTHISVVFLTDHHAYKLKKPVNFGFVDFDSPDKRRRACDDEVRLNRRLAPDVYLGVVPVTARKNGRPRAGGQGAAVDWLVKMVRLPHDHALDQLMASGQCTDHQVDRIAAALVAFYQAAPPLSLQAEAFCEGLSRHVRDNLAELAKPDHGLQQGLVRRVHSFQLSLLKLQREVFGNRVRDGRIIDGHGDLRPEHVYLVPHPVVIDCLEFSEELRRVDPVDELSFLGMECRMLGDDAVGQRILRQYIRDAADAPPRCLVSFYKAYRACVRAKVAALRAGQLPPSDERRRQHELACRYLNLADDYGREIGGPLLIITRGLSGSGKSALASWLGDALGAEHLQTDRLRSEVFGSVAAGDKYAAGAYSDDNRQRVYDEMFARANGLLTAGQSVVLDGTFLKRAQCSAAEALARQCSAVSAIVTCRCPTETAAQRISARRDRATSLSQFRRDMQLQQRADFESLGDDAGRLSVDTSGTLDGAAADVLRQLGALWPGASLARLSPDEV